MKKFGFVLLTLSLCLTTPFWTSGYSTTALAQATPSEEEGALYKKIYETQALDQKAPLCQELITKFPQSQYAAYCKKQVDRFELTKLYAKYQEAEKAFFAAGGTNDANLKALIAAGDTWLAKSPTDIGATVRVATATGFALVPGISKDYARAYADAEKALKALEPTAAPTGWKPDLWAKFRTDNTSLLLQYQALVKLRQTPADIDSSIALLTKSADMKDGLTVKDPNTYLWRAEANSTVYTKLNDTYKAFTDDEKRGDKGKEQLAKIYPVGEMIVHDYARVVALTNGKPEWKGVNDGAKEDAETYYKILMDGKTTGLDALYARYQGDVSAPNTPIHVDAPATDAVKTPVKPTTPKAGTTPVRKRP